MSQHSASPLRLVSLAAPEDDALLSEWEKHLLPLQRKEKMTCWSPRQLAAGSDRWQETGAQVAQAQILVLLLSPDFLSNEEYMLPAERTLRDQRGQQTQVLPLFVRPCSWQESLLAPLVCLPANQQAVTIWKNPDDAWQQCIQELLQVLAHRSSSTKSQTSLLTPKQRLDFVHAFQQEYARRRFSSLQGKAALALGLQERTDLLASSTHFVRHNPSRQNEPLPPGTSIIQVYDTARRGLLLLGAPGAGKTTFLLDLACELLQRAMDDPVHPIALILNLSSWGKARLPLEVWVPQQLQLAYGVSSKVSTAWMTHDEVIFLLDGLDEMEASARTACITAINAYRISHMAPLVVCSRSQEYATQEGRLIVPEVIEIQPVTLQQVTRYLQQAGSALAAVRTALRTNTTLQHLITTPLMLSVVSLTYRDQKPANLPQMGTPEEQQREIFHHYVARMLDRQQNTLTFARTRLLHTLAWLAKHMQQRHLTEFYVEQLQPDWLPSKTWLVHYSLLILLLGLLLGLLLAWLLGLLLGGPLDRLIGGSIAGLLGLLLGGSLDGLPTLIGKPRFKHVRGMRFWLNFKKRESIIPKEMINWSWRRFLVALLGFSLTGLLAGLPAGPLVLLLDGLFFGPLAMPLAGPLAGLIVGLFFGLLVGFSGSPIHANLRSTPNQGIRRSGANALRVGIPLMFCTGLMGLLLGLFFVKPLTGLGIGLMAGALEIILLGGETYFEHYLLRLLLWRSGVAPWSLVTLLEEATAGILLQRVGGGYRFIHPLLQEYFADSAIDFVDKTYPLAP